MSERNMSEINNQGVNNTRSRQQQFDEIRRNLNPEEQNNLENLLFSLLTGRRTEQTQAVYDAFNVTNEEASITTRDCLRQNIEENVLVEELSTQMEEDYIPQIMRSVSDTVSEISEFIVDKSSELMRSFSEETSVDSEC